MYTAAAWEATIAFEFLAMALDAGELIALSHTEVWFGDWNRPSIFKGARGEILNMQHPQTLVNLKTDIRDEAIILDLVVHSCLVRYSTFSVKRTLLG
jgi:hypothetical protein